MALIEIQKWKKVGIYPPSKQKEKEIYAEELRGDVALETIKEPLKQEQLSKIKTVSLVPDLGNFILADSRATKTFPHTVTGKLKAAPRNKPSFARYRDRLTHFIIDKPRNDTKTVKTPSKQEIAKYFGCTLQDFHVVSRQAEI